MSGMSEDILSAPLPAKAPPMASSTGNLAVRDPGDSPSDDFDFHAQHIGAGTMRRAVGPTAWIALAMLTLTYAFSWMDRFLLVILVDPISRELHVSNTQMGLLTGFGASVLYSLAGLPIARLADRRSRSTIIAVALGVWSTLTASLGFVRGFAGLALARCGIAVSSAGCSPAAFSLISDLFPAQRRGTAIAIYTLGISFGTWAGLTLGGLASDSFGWRSAFLVMGLPGLALAVALPFVIREPARGRFDAHAKDGERHYRPAEALRFFVGNRAFLGVALGFGLLSCSASAFENWVPTYLIRAQRLSATEVGSISGLFQGLTAIVGALIFGMAADRLARRDRRWYLWLPMIGALVVAPAVLAFFQFGRVGSYACYFVIELCVSSYSAPLFAASQNLLPPRLRALGMAAVLFVLNVVGMGLGPFLAGWASDLIGGAGPAGGLAPAIVLMQGFGLLGAAALALAARAMARD